MRRLLVLAVVLAVGVVGWLVFVRPDSWCDGFMADYDAHRLWVDNVLRRGDEGPAPFESLRVLADHERALDECPAYAEAEGRP